MAHRSASLGDMISFEGNHRSYGASIDFESGEFDPLGVIGAGGDGLLNEQEQERIDQFFQDPASFYDLIAGAASDHVAVDHVAVDPALHSSRNSVINFAALAGSEFSNRSEGANDAAHMSTPGQQVPALQGDIDVTAAASSLFDMSVNNNSSNAVTWNNSHFGNHSHTVTNPPDQPAGSSHFANFSFPSTFHTPHQSHNPAAQEAWQHMQFLSDQQGRHGHNHMQLPTHQAPADWQTPPSNFNNRHLNSNFQWGSDQSFSTQGFRGQGHSDASKHGNLLGVPMASQAAVNEYPPTPAGATRSGQSQTHFSLPTPTTFTRPSHVEDHAETHAGAPVDQAHDASLPTPTRSKRRRSAQEEDEDYAPPIRSKGPTKRATKSGKSSKSIIKTEDLDGAVSEPSPKHRKSSAPNGNLADSPGGSPHSFVDPEASAESPSQNSGDAKARQNLSEGQKRVNHIQSEQRRRNLIKGGYSDIMELVPALKNGKAGLSKSDALFETVRFIERMKAANDYFEGILGVRFEKVKFANDNGGDGDGDGDAQDADN